VICSDILQGTEDMRRGLGEAEGMRRDCGETYTAYIRQARVFVLFFFSFIIE